MTRAQATDGARRGPHGALKAFAARRADTATEPCGYCGAPLPQRHDHIVEVTSLHLSCSCSRCSILFANTRERRRVPSVCERLDWIPSNAGWAGLGLPVQLAFFVRRSGAGRTVAFYPGPGGPVECTLPAGAWEALASEHAPLSGLEHDVEALLVSRLDGDCLAFRVSLDRCFELTGLLRSRWRGFSGGDDAWSSLRAFLAQLDEGSRA